MIFRIQLSTLSLRQAQPRNIRGLPAGGKKKKAGTGIPQQGASASPVEVADLWNDAIVALGGLGYTEGDAIAAIRIASGKMTEAGVQPTLEKLIMNSLQLLSRGV